ncbi:MAG: hypothetical protein GY801_44450, partial [bacterium]|nr:hypothetical protein [bacterium]
TRRAHDAKEKFTQQINKDQMGRVVAEVDEYATAFSVYVEAEHERNATMEVMRTQARKTLAHIAEVREEQAQQLADRRIMSATKEQAQRTNVDDASRMINWILKAVTEEKNFMFKGHREEAVAAAEQFFSDTIILAKMIKLRFADEKNITHTDSIISLAEAHLEDFTRYVKLENPKKESAAAMAKDLSGLTVWAKALWMEQRNAILASRQDSQESSLRLKEHV